MLRLFLGIIFFIFAFASSAAETHIVINEIKLRSAEKANDEFVELYNPNNEPVVLTGWAIKRKSSSGKEYSLVSSSRLEGKTIPARGYLLTAREEEYSGSIMPDVLWAQSNEIASNNTILLYDPKPLYDPNGNPIPIDKVGFGGAADFEAQAAPNPEAGESIERKNNADTDNNQNDFVILSAPTPTNSKSAASAPSIPEPVLEPTPQEPTPPAEPTPDNQQLTPDNQQLTTNNQQLTTDNQQPTISNQQQTAEPPVESPPSFTATTTVNASPTPHQSSQSSDGTGQVSPTGPISSISPKELTIRGVVLVEPYKFGKQIFYIVSDKMIAGQMGMQIFMQKSDFPALEVGDYLEVSGILSQAAGEQRIKIKNKEDIKILNHQSAPEPVLKTIGEINAQTIGSYVKIQGEIIETRGKREFYAEDATGEIKVLFKDGVQISSLVLNEGERVAVSGIIRPRQDSKTSPEQIPYQILPRSSEDIFIEEKIEEFPPAAETSAPGATKYVLATVGFALISFGALWKLRKK